MCSPTAPNPADLIQQQTQSNRDTAITQSNLNMIDQTDASGNKLNYTQNGTWADGTPRYSVATTLSDPNQQLLTTNQGTQQNLADLSQQQSAGLAGSLSQPIDFSQQKDYLEGLTSGALDKRWDQLSQQNETDLINRGIRPGSTQYDNLKNQFAVNQSDAYNSANVNNYNTALQSQLALRNQPINEFLSLAGGGQVQMPTFGSTPSTGVAGTDAAGIAQTGFANEMARYNNQQGILGGLFSAGANLLPLLSDRRTKTEIRRIGYADNGIPIYAYRYINGDTTQIGMLADEVEEIHPEAVVMGTDGFQRVDYGLAVL